MFNLCNGTFRIEGSGGLRKPLQLGCDCQLLKAFVCRVFCCFKGYTLKSPADHTARSPRKPQTSASIDNFAYKPGEWLLGG